LLFLRYLLPKAWIDVEDSTAILDIDRLTSNAKSKLKSLNETPLLAGWSAVPTECELGET